MSKLWGGRFSKAANELLRQFNDSITFDQRLYAQDIAGSLAWVQGLVKAGLLTADEGKTLTTGLNAVLHEFETNTFIITEGDEDIHTAVERRLTELVGVVGGKLHTGRSRNDQVATDFRLWVKTAIDALQSELKALQTAMVDHAEAHHAVPMPGYTHLQHAQPITWGHWLLSHVWPLVRDSKRLALAYEIADESPLGSAALAGTAFPIDRALLAEQLDFGSVSQNSLDAVSNRDFVADFLYACAMMGVHLSRLSEQLILFSTHEFGFVRVDDAFSTGSSLMPQKKNPDTLELTRGKSGRLLGLLTGFLATLKGLPSSYDKDLQEDKEPVFMAFDTLMIVLPVMTGVIETLAPQPEKMLAQLEPGLLATDLADYLVRKGLPFREAHHVVGQVVQAAEKAGQPLTVLPLGTLQAIHPLFGADAVEALTIEGSLAAREAVGGTAPSAVLAQIKSVRQAIG